MVEFSFKQCILSLELYDIKIVLNGEKGFKQCIGSLELPIKPNKTKRMRF